MNKESNNFGHCDIYVEDDGEAYNTAFLNAITAQTFAKLFYIELERLPRFFQSPEVCSITIKCRVRPGHTLMDLLYRLDRLQIQISYRGDEYDYVSEPLLSLDMLQSCRNGGPFRKELRAKAYSLDTVIDLKLISVDGSAYSISHCPYELRQLISDQGLNSAFGRSDHKILNSSSLSQENDTFLHDAITHMQGILHQVQEDSICIE